MPKKNNKERHSIYEAVKATKEVPYRATMTHAPTKQDLLWEAEELALREEATKRESLPQSRPMVCLCGSLKIDTTLNVGWDCGEGMEERQHLDVCLACKRTRIWAEVFDEEHGRYIAPGVWDEPAVFRW